MRHQRFRLVEHAFAYQSYFLLLPMRGLRKHPEWPLPRNRFGLLSFYDADHGDGRADSLAWLEKLLQEEGIADAVGEIWLQCFPRVLGHTFKPVSFWYCHRSDDTLAAVIVEVNNTFGERHCYLLPGGPDLAFGREARATKVFHVSPFCSVEGEYRFRFLRTDLHPPGSNARKKDARIISCIDYHDAKGLILKTSMSGRLQPLSRTTVRAAFFTVPLMTWGVVARIHWQALRLWARGLPWFAKPLSRKPFVSR